MPYPTSSPLLMPLPTAWPTRREGIKIYFSVVVGSHHHACTGCLFAVSGEAMLLAGCCTSVRLFPHEQVPPPSPGQVPTVHGGARISEEYVLWVSQQEFPAFSAAHKWRVCSHCGYTGRPSSQLCNRFGKYCVYQSKSLALIAAGLIPLARSRVWVETQQI